MQSRINVNVPEKNNKGLSVLNGLYQYFKGVAPTYSLDVALIPIYQAIDAGQITTIDRPQLAVAVTEAKAKANDVFSDW